ncbi:hypothetical protein DL98DRAFT_109808 [Cadophora sp. DSE1049]|nr:hypothetical protein DL98DRAFT_109808 [Cadophora sp. DSE1049]
MAWLAYHTFVLFGPMQPLHLRALAALRGGHGGCCGTNGTMLMLLLLLPLLLGALLSFAFDFCPVLSCAGLAAVEVSAASCLLVQPCSRAVQTRPEPKSVPPTSEQGLDPRASNFLSLSAESLKPDEPPSTLPNSQSPSRLPVSQNLTMT